MRELASRIPLPRHRAADLERYRGRLASFATTSGERFVASCWDESPFGSWCGLLVAEADGCRTLYVESEILADDVRLLHDIDNVVLADVRIARAGQEWAVEVDPVEGPPLSRLTLTLGSPTRRGAVISRLPSSVTETRGFAWFTEIMLRVLSLGVPSFRAVYAVGRLRDGRREHHCAGGERVITAVSGTYTGRPLGNLTDLTACGFGFSDPPRHPAVGEMTALRQR